MNDDTRTEGQVGRHGTAVVNGPEGDGLDWGSVDWPEVEDQVRRLRQRIFTASRAGTERVRNLQKLMLRSRANALVSVRRVTERNAGRKTAGIDGTVVVTAPGKAALADSVQRHDASWKPKPVKRVYIARPTGRSARSGYPSFSIGRCKPMSSMHWNPSGRHGSSRSPMAFGRAVAAMTHLVHLHHRERQVRPPVLGTRCRPGRSIRPDRPFPPLNRPRHVPRQGTDRAVAEGRGDREGRLAPTEEGTPQGALCGAPHNPPYEQRLVMHSVDLSGLVRAVSGAERCA